MRRYNENVYKSEEAIKAAVKDYYDKNGIQYDEELFKPDNCHYTHEH